MLIGIMAGTISVIGYAFVQPRLQRLTGGVDTCGVHNLHGMPGVFGGLVAMALVASPLWQLTGIIVTVAFAVTMGFIVGFIVSRLGRKQTPYEDKDEFLSVEEGNLTL
jgi:ammonium transporter Rh